MQLELGGKGANIVFDDALLPAAVGGSAFAIFHNQGQACIAGSRLILHESIADQIPERFRPVRIAALLNQPVEFSQQTRVDRNANPGELTHAYILRQGGAFVIRRTIRTNVLP